jgi:hypothetical protein
VIVVACFLNLEGPKRGPPSVDISVFHCESHDTFSICLIDLSTILDCPEEDTSVASIILLYSLLCSHALIAYSSSPDPYNILELFALIHHLLYFSFSGETKALNACIGSSLELIFLSSDKGLKNSEKILNSVLQFEDGYDDAVVARNQVRELMKEVFTDRSGIAIPPSKPRNLGDFLTSTLCNR